MTARSGSLDPSEPDIQYSLYVAQRDFARSGRDYLKKSLVDLLADKCESSPGSLISIVLSESIETVAKLTPGQISILTTSWLIRHSEWYVKTEEEFVEWGRSDLAPFVDSIPTSASQFGHLQYSGCAAIEMGTLSIQQAIHDSYPGVIQ